MGKPMTDTNPRGTNQLTVESGCRIANCSKLQHGPTIKCFASVHPNVH